MNLGFSHHSLFPQAVCNFSCLNATVLLRATSELVTVRVGGAVGRRLGRRLLGGALGRLCWEAPLGWAYALLLVQWSAYRPFRPCSVQTDWQPAFPGPALCRMCLSRAAEWRLHPGPCFPEGQAPVSPALIHVHSARNKCFVLLTGRLCYSVTALWIREGAAQIFGKLKWVT